MSKNIRQTYPLEFKLSAVKLAFDSYQPTSQTMRYFGVNPNNLYSWIVKYSNSNKNNPNNMTNHEKSLKYA